jgi:hypothetical protein
MQKLSRSRTLCCKMIRPFALIPFLSLFAVPCAGFPADICKAKVLRNVSPIDNPHYVLRQGAYDTAITQYRINKQTGRTSFCSEGGGCFPTHVNIGGHLVEALRMANCKIGALTWENAQERVYAVVVDRAANPPEVLRYNDADDSFIGMGLCRACAANLATIYVGKPNSSCAKLARQALQGDAEARRTLLSDPAYCHYTNLGPKGLSSVP